MELKNLGQTTVSALIHMDIRLEREHWTMFRNKLLGITAAATLGSAAMLGTTTANAAIDVDLPADEVMKVTYAKETLTDAADAMIEVNGTKYYLVETGGENALDIRVRMDYAATGQESIYLRFDLSGMVFGEAVTGYDLGRMTLAARLAVSR